MSIADYIRAVLSIKKLPKPEEQLNELIDLLTEESITKELKELNEEL